MSGRSRLPPGELRRASQRRARRADVPTLRIEVPFRPGDAVKWRDRAGVYKREDGENVFIEIAGRLYRVERRELRPG
jgi:hypothetical protein